MWWMAVVGAANGLLQGSAGRATAKANNRISAVNTETGNRLRQYKNVASAAQTSLQRWQQSVNNQRVMNAGGDQLNASTQNFLRSVDARTFQDINQSISDSEQLGAQSAQQGAQGMMGGVTDMVDTSTRIRQGLVSQLTKTAKDQARYDQTVRAGIILSQTVQSMDSSLIVDSLDFSADYAQKTPVLSHWANAIQGAGSAFGATGQGWDIMKNSGGGTQTTSVGNQYSLSGSGVRFGFNQPSADSNPYSLGPARFSGSTGADYSLGNARFSGSSDSTGSNPYSLWGGK